jgi:integrase
VRGVRAARMPPLPSANKKERIAGEAVGAAVGAQGKCREKLSLNQQLAVPIGGGVSAKPTTNLFICQWVQNAGRIASTNRYTFVGKIFLSIIERFKSGFREAKDHARPGPSRLTMHQMNHRPTIVHPAGIGALLRAIDGFDGQPTTRVALQLAALVFGRPGELRHAEWEEIHLDAAIWSIPAEKMKMRRQHRVPLARQSLAILRELQEITGSGRWLFPSVRTVTRPISENTLNAALRRLGYGSETMSTHGFRAMAATRLNEMGRWNPDAIERQLAHQEANAVRRAYMHSAEYWSERVSMMQGWADCLDDLRENGRWCRWQKPSPLINFGPPCGDEVEMRATRARRISGLGPAF